MRPRGSAASSLDDSRRAIIMDFADLKRLLFFLFVLGVIACGQAEGPVTPRDRGPGEEDPAQADGPRSAEYFDEAGQESGAGDCLLECGRLGACEVKRGVPRCVCGEGAVSRAGECVPEDACAFASCGIDDTCVNADGTAQCHAPSCGPEYIGSWTGFSYEVAQEGDLLYSANGAGGLLIVRLGEGATLTKVAELKLPSAALRVTVSGGYAYVGTLSSGTGVVDVRDPEAPQVLSMIPSGGFVSRVQVRGDRLYVLDGAYRQVVLWQVVDFGSFRIFDLGDPAAPVELSETRWTTRIGRGLTFVEEHAIIPGEEDTIVLDLSDEMAPLEASTLSLSARAVAMAGRTAWFADRTGLQAVDLSDFTAPVLGQSVETPGQSFAVSIEGSLAYVADSDGYTTTTDPPPSSILTFDVSDVGAPQLISSIETEGGTHSLALTDEHFLTAGGAGGPEVYSRHDETLVASHPAPGYVGTVAFEQGSLYVASGGQLLIASLEDGAHPKLERIIFPEHRPSGVLVRDEIAYIFGRDGLEIFDTSVQRRPQHLGFLPLSPASWRYALVEQHLYLLQRSTYGDTITLKIIDVSALDAPRLAASLVLSTEQSSNPKAILVEDGRAYISNENEGLHIVDVSDSEHPVELGTWKDPSWGSVSEVALKEGLVYAATAEGLAVLDLSDTEAPLEVGGFKSERYSRYYQVKISGDIAHVLSGISGTLNSFDVSEPSLPVLLSQTDTVSQAKRLRMWGGYAYISSDYEPDGLHVVDVPHRVPDQFVRSYHIPQLGSFRAKGLGDAFFLHAENEWEGEPAYQLSHVALNSGAETKQLKANSYYYTLHLAPQYIYARSRAGIDLFSRKGGLGPLVGHYEADGLTARAVLGSDLVVTRQSELLLLGLDGAAGLAEIASYTLPDSAWSVSVLGAHLLVSSLDFPLLALKRGDSGALELAAEYPSHRMTKVDRSMVYAFNEEELTVFDGSVPSDMQIVATVPLGFPVYSVLQLQGHLLASGWSRNAALIDVTTPEAPTVTPYGVPTSFSSSDMFVNEDELWIAQGEQLTVWDPFACQLPD